MIAALLRKKEQGAPIASQTLPERVLESVGTSLSSLEVCREVFEVIQKMFEDPSLKRLSKQAQIVGVMSDSLSVNGFACRLHDGENKYLISVTAGTLLKGIVVVYRLLGYQALQLGGTDAIQEATSRFYVSAFSMPRRLTARKWALASAIYGMLAIFCHELAHVLRGHTSFAYQELGLDALTETETSSDSSTLDVLRLMEIDADEYAGRFLADILFREYVFSKRLLDNEEATKKFLQVAAGVLAIYLGFGKRSGLYYSGSVRATLVLASLLKACSDDIDANGWLRGVLHDIQNDIVGAGLVDQDELLVEDAEKDELVNVSIPARNEIQRMWLARQPWQS